MHPDLVSEFNEVGAGMSQMTVASLYAWVYMNLLSNTILLPILVTTFVLSKAKRHPTLINVCLTWIASGIYSCLLFYANRHIGPEPSFGLCVAQTSLLTGITPMWSVAVFTLIYHMTVAFDAKAQKKPTSRAQLFFIVIAPYVTQIAFSVAALVVSLQHPQDVSRDRKVLYCSVDFNPLSNAMSIFTLLVGMGITVLLIQLTITLYRTWKCLTENGRATAVELSVIIRVVLFGIYIFFGMCVSVVAIFDTTNMVPDIYVASTGTVLFLVFGTQADVWRVWMFWRKPTPQLVVPRSAIIGPSSSDRSDYKINFDEDDKSEKFSRSSHSSSSTNQSDEESMVGLDSGRKKTRVPPPLDLNRGRS